MKIEFISIFIGIQTNKKKAKFKIGDTVRISKYKRKVLTEIIPQIRQKKFLLLPMC